MQKIMHVWFAYILFVIRSDGIWWLNFHNHLLIVTDDVYAKSCELIHLLKNNLNENLIVLFHLWMFDLI